MPPVWSPCSDPTTTYLIGCGVSFATSGDQALDVVDRALAFSDQHAGAGDHDQVVDGHRPLGRIDLLVGVDILGKLGDAREIADRETAEVEIGGAGPDPGRRG